MEEEIIVNEIPETIVDEVTDTIEETEEVPEMEEENMDFDPDDDIFDEDDGLYEIGGYDLSGLNDILFLDDPENVEVVNKFIDGLQDQGFTQEQVEFLIRKEMEGTDDEPKKAKSAKDIQENLSKSLTKEEKRNYKAVNAFLSEAISGTELGDFRHEIMGNPNLVKLINVIYTKSLGKTTNLNATASRKSEKQVRSLSFDEAKGQLMKCVTSRGNAKELASQLSKQVSDKESFNAIAKAMGLL